MDLHDWYCALRAPQKCQADPKLSDRARHGQKIRTRARGPAHAAMGRLVPHRARPYASGMSASPTVVVRALYRALEEGKPVPELAAIFAEGVSTLEHPNLIKPKGARASRADMLAAAEKGAALFASQRYDVRSIVEVEGTVVVRLTWTGTVARDLGPFREGQILTAHIAQFIEVRDGRVLSIETYDCYEP